MEKGAFVIAMMLILFRNGFACSNLGSDRSLYR